jgi:hypothetical protein
VPLCPITYTLQHAVHTKNRYLYLDHKSTSTTQVLITGSSCQKQHFHQIQLLTQLCHMVNGYISLVCSIVIVIFCFNLLIIFNFSDDCA